LVAVREPGAGRLCAAHLNHQLRPEADGDEQFVVELCQSLSIPCEVGRVDVAGLAAETGDGLEAAARKARYTFLKTTAAKLGARFVVTAHTADDQAETILHRIIRGTGMRGLSGMARTRPIGHATLIRPLLGIHRKELEAYLRAVGQTFRCDESNKNLRFTRNRLRNETMPYLRDRFNPGVTDALLRLGSLAKESQALIDANVDELFRQSVQLPNTNEAHIRLPPISDRPQYLVRELLMAVWRQQGWALQAMGHQKWDELCEMVRFPSLPRRILPGNISAEIHGDSLILQNPRTPKDELSY
jgi:tRNA(Ile)-lysidine synthase